MSKLTELDLKYLSKLIGRDANEHELRLIEDTLRNKLNIRRYLEIVARLNKGAKRNPKELDEVLDNMLLKTFNSLKVYSNKKVEHQDNNFLELISSNLLHKSKILSYYGKEFDQTLNKKYNDKDYDLINYRSNDHSANDIIFETDIELFKMVEIDILDYSKYGVFKIDFGNDIKKNRSILNSLIDTSVKEDWFISAKLITENGINNTLINILNELKSGIVVGNKISFESLFEKTKLSLLVVGKNSKKVNQYCQKNGLTLTKIGKLNDEGSFQFEQKDVQINLPMSAFELQYDVNTVHFEQPIISDFNSKEIIKGAKNNSYSNQLLKLFEKIFTNNRMVDSENSGIDKYGFEQEITSLDKKISIIASDCNNLLLTAPRSSAKIAVANAARKMACMGLTPKYINIHNLFSEEDSSTNWFASEILQGQEEAVRELELTITNRKISQYDDAWQQNVSVIGFGNRNINAGIKFKDEADFISLLGSHRGELIGTEYNRYINNKVNSVVPTVDLNMERRLQDVVQQGVSTNLLKSATNVSIGGISTAVAMSLAVSESGIGAKIHLSRKLTNEELLFGETQGLVIVTLSEEDIMEFERICMSVGVPSTTIGRVTNTNQYTFNDLININVDKIRKT